jgi:hypothetical protein
MVYSHMSTYIDCYKKYYQIGVLFVCMYCCYNHNVYRCIFTIHVRFSLSIEYVLYLHWYCVYILTITNVLLAALIILIVYMLTLVFNITYGHLPLLLSLILLHSG